MRTIKRFILALSIFFGMSMLAHAQEETSKPRGELLYSTFCAACHTTELHWRGQKLATDWYSLKAQVKRWQAYQKLGWSEKDITDVALYLNAKYYHFLNTEPKAISQGIKHKQ